MKLSASSGGATAHSNTTTSDGAITVDKVYSFIAPNVVDIHTGVTNNTGAALATLFKHDVDWDISPTPLVILGLLQRRSFRQALRLGAFFLQPLVAGAPEFRPGRALGLAGRFGFAQEATQRRGVGRQGAGEELDGHVALDAGVVGLEDHAHSALPEDAGD